MNILFLCLQLSHVFIAIESNEFSRQIKEAKKKVVQSITSIPITGSTSLILIEVIITLIVVRLMNQRRPA